jgi:hypothetical protein
MFQRTVEVSDCSSKVGQALPREVAPTSSAIYLSAPGQGPPIVRFSLERTIEVLKSQIVVTETIVSMPAGNKDSYVIPIMKKRSAVIADGLLVVILVHGLISLLARAT